MNKEVFSFYGTLKDHRKLEDGFAVKVESSQDGYLEGSLLKVVDYSEPSGNYIYPILDLENEGKVVAVLVVINLEENQRSQFINKLLEYEGPLYELSETFFYDTDGNPLSTFVFAWNKNSELPTAKIFPMEPQEDGVYNW